MILDGHWNDYPDTPTGPLFLKVIDGIAQVMDEGTDHFPLFIMGDTNTGKSSVLLTIYDRLFLRATVDNIAFTRAEFARVQARVATEDHPRFVGYDEADVNSKEAMSRWNRDIKKLFDNTRFSKILWVLCNPSVRGLDKAFIEDEVIKGLVVIIDKATDRPRRLVYYRKKDLLKLVDAGISLSLRNLIKKPIMVKYAYLLSWFRKYDGRLWVAYQEKKTKRVEEHHLTFGETWGKGSFNQGAVAKQLHVNPKSVKRYTELLIEEGQIRVEDVLSPSGHWSYTKDHIDLLRSRMQQNADDRRGRPLFGANNVTGYNYTRESDENNRGLEDG